MTRPDIDDILSGVQRLLMNDLAPALAEQPFLAEQAMYASLVLEYCKKAWPRAHVTLAEEHADLRATLDAVGRALREDADAHERCGTIGRALDETRCEVASTALDVVAAYNRTLRAEVSRIVTWLEGRPASTPATLAARAATDAYLGRLADRQHRELQTLGISW
ncbi:MAG: hypothetical protein AB1689_03210 [Thermodesulfobacteriota bacterium]